MKRIRRILYSHYINRLASTIEPQPYPQDQLLRSWAYLGLEVRWGQENGSGVLSAMLEVLLDGEPGNAVLLQTRWARFCMSMFKF